jgi:dipeptidyl aminopeptidase/acylaminoacyl peptidase
MVERKRVWIGFLALALAWSFMPGADAQTAYQKPAKPILDVLDAPDNPKVSVSPARDVLLLAQPVHYPAISDLAEPMLRLAGSRINPKTNGPHRPLMQSTALTLKPIPSGKETRLPAPPGAKFGAPIWSPDGKQFAITNTTLNNIELWIGETQGAKLRKLPGIRVNLAFGSGVEWVPDGKSLLVHTVVPNRGPAPAAPTVPEGPNVQENYGKVSPAWTYQDLL